MTCAPLRQKMECELLFVGALALTKSLKLPSRETEARDGLTAPSARPFFARKRKLLLVYDLLIKPYKNCLTA